MTKIICEENTTFRRNLAMKSYVYKTMCKNDESRQKKSVG